MLCINKNIQRVKKNINFTNREKGVFLSEIIAKEKDRGLKDFSELINLTLFEGKKEDKTNTFFELNHEGLLSREIVVEKLNLM